MSLLDDHFGVRNFGADWEQASAETRATVDQQRRALVEKEAQARYRTQCFERDVIAEVARLRGPVNVTTMFVPMPVEPTPGLVTRMLRRLFA